ncbi:MAG: fibronectin type III domain-containing protein [Candidatus Kerfeldbacteria bacterium]|nr:fibronectin type III domain-containing protein [Candidatus Kerfeldbacteria bacterium]
MVRSGLIVSSLLAVLPLAVAAGDNPCGSVVIDNNTADWEEVESIVTDEADLTGTDYYYSAAGWSTTASDSDRYSTNIDLMSDLENLKVCNTATQLQLYIDSIHPLLSVYDLSEEKYYEFGDTDGPGEDVGLPADLDLWLVFKMQKGEEGTILYYGVYLHALLGEIGMEAGPEVTAIYEETDATDFASASFNPNEDTLLVTIEAEKGDESKDSESGKNVDSAGGFETDLNLTNSDGTGLLNLESIDYGDKLRLAVQTYTGSDFETAAVSATDSAQDSTARVSYTIKKIGVQNVAVAKAKITSDSARVTWDELSDVQRYTVQLRSLTGKVISTTNSTTTKANLVDLVSNHRYQVRVRAKIGGVLTPWSESVRFKTTD